MKISFSTCKIQRTKREFQNIAFRRSTSLTIKQKIHTISNLSEKAGFYCSDWFPLGSFTRLQVGFLFKKTEILAFKTQLAFCFLFRYRSSWMFVCCF